MKRKNFLKKLSFLSLSPLLFPKLLKAEIETFNYMITDECVSCGACVDESENELIIEVDGDDYIFNPSSGCINFVWDAGKKANIGGDYCYSDIENLMDVCPVDAIIEI